MSAYAGYDPKTTKRIIESLREEDAAGQLHKAIKAADPKMKHAFTPKVAKKMLKGEKENAKKNSF